MARRDGTEPEIELPAGVARLAEVFRGFGDPEAAWACVRDHLRRLDAPHEERGGHPSTGEWYVLAYLCAHLDLTGHGGSVGGGWLTDDGRAVLEFLDRWTPDWQDRDDARFLHGGVEYSNS